MSLFILVMHIVINSHLKSLARLSAKPWRKCHTAMSSSILMRKHLEDVSIVIGVRTGVRVLVKCWHQRRGSRRASRAARQYQIRPSADVTDLISHIYRVWFVFLEYRSCTSHCGGPGAKTARVESLERQSKTIVKTQKLYYTIRGPIRHADEGQLHSSY